MSGEGGAGLEGPVCGGRGERVDCLDGGDGYWAVSCGGSEEVEYEYGLLGDEDGGGDVDRLDEKGYIIRGVWVMWVEMGDMSIRMYMVI